MIGRTYLGLDVRTGELRSAALRRTGRHSSLTGGRILSLAEGALVSSWREPNIRQVRSIVEALREVLSPLAGREERIALSLPESSGRILLTELETSFKTRQEGLEVVKWQLKNSLPLSPADVQLDYQILERSETGRQKLLVAWISKPVLEQIEEIVTEAGYSPALVDFHSLSRYSYYRPRLDLGENFILLGVDASSFSFQLFQGGLLVFHRVREMETTADILFRELNLTLVGCREKHPAARRAQVFAHCELEEPSLPEVMATACECEVILLDPHLERMAAETLDLPRWRSRSLVTAIGAAERMM